MSLFMLSALSQAQRKVEIAEPVQQNLADANARVIKRKVAIGRFSNETQYAKGIFYDKENDPMGKQALDILSAKLAASGKFLLLERSDLASLLEEAKKGEGDLSTIGADYMIIGSVTEFGRKNVGKSGAFTSTKQQVVEAAVSIRLVEVATGLIIYSDKPWRTYFLSYDNDAQLIAGGASQGIKVGDTFAVKTKGKKVKNPQTGVMIELPGKQIGSVTVSATGGDTPETEYSFVTFTSTGGNVDADHLTDYYIEEIK